MKYATLTGAIAMTFLSGIHAENIVRNGGFEYGTQYNGSPVRIGKFDVGNRIREVQKTRMWRSTPFEGWWMSVSKGMDMTAEDSGKALRITGKGILYSDPQPFPGNTATLSLDVKTQNAKGSVSLEFLRKNGNRFQRPVIAEKKISLPENTNGKFIRLAVTLSGQENHLAALKLNLDGGSAELDNVQIESGTQATAFQPRPGEWLGLAFDDFPPEQLPRYYADGKDAEKTGKKIVTITNSSNIPLTGTLNVYLDRWNKAGQTLLKSFELKKLAPGKHVSLNIDPGKLPHDGYIVLAELIRNGKTIISKDIFNPEKTGNGVIGEHMLRSYNGMRFCVFPGVTPAKTFGVGNGMVGTNQWYAGVELANFVLARETGVVGLSGSLTEEGAIYMSAIGGAQHFGGYWIDAASKKAGLNNPATRNALDIFHPEAKKELKQRAEEVGKLLARGPGINGLKLRNESPYFNGGVICPTPAADADFRAWCRKRHGSLANLNKRWGTTYKNWNEIEQIVSARMVKDHKAVDKKGAGAIDWYANLGRLGDNVGTLMKQNPGRAMDWCRWRTEASLKLYGDFIDEIRKHNRETLIGNNFCWPNFWPHLVMPFYRKSGAPMMDQQYAAGHGIDLGNSDEMLDMIEMAESTVPGKPIWGIETYVQPSFPDNFPALQNWGMVAHGMTNNLVFAWKPYSDHGPKAFASGPGSWKRPGAKPMWFLIDTDGTKLPLWDSNLKSAKEIAAFHKKYDALSLKRLKSRIGWYIPDDTAEFIVFLTTNKPYASKLTHARISAAAQLRMNGVTLNYLDDATLPSIHAKNYDTILLAPSPVISDKAAGILAKFVKDGGTLVLFGPCGAFDPWLNHRTTFGGDAWRELAWNVPKHWKDIDSFLSDFNTPSPNALTTCRDFPSLPGAAESQAIPGLRERKWGKGRLISCAVYPSRNTPMMHTPEALNTHLRNLIRIAGLNVNGWWQADRKNTASDLKARIGHGAPIVEVVLREKSPKERFAFVLNQGGSGGGTVCIPVGKRTIQATDALTGEPVSGTVSNGIWKLRMNVAPWQYRVIRMIAE